MFSTTKASRKVQKCSELQTNANSFPAKSVQISLTNRHISQWCASRGFLFAAVHECDNSHQIAAAGTGNNHLLQTNDFGIFCIFLHVSGFESLVAKITETHSAGVFSPAIPIAESSGTCKVEVIFQQRMSSCLVLWHPCLIPPMSGLAHSRVWPQLSGHDGSDHPKYSVRKKPGYHLQQGYHYCHQ